MNEPDKLIDLAPTEWRSEREKPYEPFFGVGWPLGLAILISVIAATLAHEYEWGVFGKLAASTLGPMIAGAIYQIRS